MLGATRAGDLAVNVILPWLHARAGSGRNKAFVDRAQERFFHWPKTQDNARLRVARERLFGGSGGGLKTAAHQQGLLQILHDFCAQSNALCEDCPFPGLARRFGEKT